jgi:hypothetical protein
VPDLEVLRLGLSIGNAGGSAIAERIVERIAERRFHYSPTTSTAVSRTRLRY